MTAVTTAPVPAPTTTSSRLPGALRLGMSRGRLEVLQFFRERDAFVFTFLLPVLFVVIFGTIFAGQQIAPGLDFKQVFIPGMIAAGLLTVSFQSLAIGIALERDDGTLKRLAGTPMPRAAYFIGKMITVLVTAAGEIALLLGIGALGYGLDLPATLGKWVTFGWVSLLGTLACTLLGIAYSSLPRSGRSASAVVTVPVLVLEFISGVFLSFYDLPGWLQQAAAVFPLKWMTQGMRAVFLPDSFAHLEMAGSWELGRVGLWLGVWVIGGTLFSLRTFRWRKSD